MKLPTSLSLTWQPENMEIKVKSGYSMNPKQVEYLKQVIKTINTMYGDISNAVNANQSELDFVRAAILGTL